MLYDEGASTIVKVVKIVRHLGSSPSEIGNLICLNIYIACSKNSKSGVNTCHKSVAPIPICSNDD